MSEEDRHLEHNVGHLIRAACGPSTRPSTEASERTYQLLLNHVRTRSSESDFPDIAVAVLGAVSAIIAIWAVVQVIWNGRPFRATPLLLITVIWATLNLALVPVASIVILRRRQSG